MVFDFDELLDSFGRVHEQVGAGAFGAEGPDLARVVVLPFLLVYQDFGTRLGVL